MKGGQVAAAVGIGYFLGRTKKMRVAMMIAAAGAIGKLGGGPPQLLRRSYQWIADSPEVGELTESVRGDLLGAAKSAAMTAATSRIESLNSRLLGRMGTSDEQRPDEDETDDENRDENGERPKPARPSSPNGSPRTRATSTTSRSRR